MTRITSDPRSEKLGTLNEDNDITNVTLLEIKKATLLYFIDRFNIVTPFHLF